MTNNSNRLLSEAKNNKFDIKKGEFQGVEIHEIRGEPSTGKTKLMLDSFLLDFLAGYDDGTFKSYIISPNQRISDYFLTTINNMLFPTYKDDKAGLAKINKILYSRILTISTLVRGNVLDVVEVDNAYVDPADYMSIIDMLQLVTKLKDSNVKNIYFFRNC